MADYRIHPLDSAGLIEVGIGAKCATDEEACALAQRMLTVGGKAEIWAGTRCVGRVSATSAAEIVALGRRWAAPARPGAVGR